jgi:hypothetical protein
VDLRVPVEDAVGDARDEGDGPGAEPGAGVVVMAGGDAGGLVAAGADELNGGGGGLGPGGGGADTIQVLEILMIIQKPVETMSKSLARDFMVSTGF